MGRENFCRVRNVSCVSKRDIQRMYALNSYGETDKTRGTGTVVRGRIGKCQYEEFSDLFFFLAVTSSFNFLTCCRNFRISSFSFFSAFLFSRGLSYRSTKSDQVNTDRRNFVGPHCFKCKGRGHYQRECIWDGTGEFLSRAKCQLCFQEGHNQLNLLL
jgi:hypothetical protein